MELLEVRRILSPSALILTGARPTHATTLSIKVVFATWIRVLNSKQITIDTSCVCAYIYNSMIYYIIISTYPHKLICIHNTEHTILYICITYVYTYAHNTHIYICIHMYTQELWHQYRLSMPFASICILVLPFASSRHNQWFFPSVLEETQRRQAAESELLRRKPPQTDTSTDFDFCALNLHKLALTAAHIQSQDLFAYLGRSIPLLQDCKCSRQVRPSHLAPPKKYLKPSF